MTERLAGTQVKVANNVQFTVPTRWTSDRDEHGLQRFTAHDGAAVIRVYEAGEGKGFDRFIEAIAATAKSLNSDPSKAQQVKLGQLDAVASMGEGLTAGREFVWIVFLSPDPATDTYKLGFTTRFAVRPRLPLIVSIVAAADKTDDRADIQSIESSFRLAP